MKLIDFDLDRYKQYYFDRDDFVKYVDKYSPLLIEYMWDQGCFFNTDSFFMFRKEDEFYILHVDSGIMINWYKHLGRTNTCNRDIDKEVFKEFLILLNNEILENI